MLTACEAGDSKIPIILIHGFDWDETAFDQLLINIQNDFPDRKVVAPKIMFRSFSSIFTGTSRYVRGVATAIRKAARGSQCIDLIGHSQGGLMARAYIQLYSGFHNNHYPEVRNFISLAGAQGGYFCDDQCSSFDSVLVDSFMSFFKKHQVAYSSFSQTRIMPGGYWRSISLQRSVPKAMKYFGSDKWRVHRPDFNIWTRKVHQAHQVLHLLLEYRRNAASGHVWELRDVRTGNGELPAYHEQPDIPQRQLRPENAVRRGQVEDLPS
ncbi:Palmitoyl-protein_thioesterase [Hexamita inflata]|uniref:Palmitoyl-protein_thioesterase n=1 Tax=Hexamita inflata TaxID=28002 RepID=A0ABP1HMV0_9EUKA